MTKEELKELLKENKLSDSKKISAAALANIIKFAAVNLRMDDKTLDYYYDVSIDELLGSEMPDEEYNVMKEQGWTINENYLKILI
jgi:hypothetical protein